jgi:hypothetical protein
MASKGHRAKERLDVAIAKLEAGWPETAWACREYLSLSAEPDALEVIRAVHDIIHAWQKHRTAACLKQVRAAVVAAGVLLRTMNWD